MAAPVYRHDVKKGNRNDSATARPAHTEVHNLHTLLGLELTLVHARLGLAP